MSKHRLLLAVVSAAVVSVGCAAGAAPPPSPTAPTPSPTPEGLEHPTGPTDVVLRMEEGGGFVPIDFLATQAPIFTLFGDGRIVFQPLVTEFPQPGADGITRSVPWRTAQLDAGQIEELLTFALGPGGLGAARDTYMSNAIADAPSTIFDVDAGGVKKTVSVNALGMEATGGPDDAARKSFQRLAERLRDFDEGGNLASDVYAPAAYRAVIIEREADPLVTAVPWPWPDIEPADFSQPKPDGSGPPFPHRTLSTDDVAKLDVGEVPGGMQGLILKAPDGKTYSFVLRPLLPNETE